MKFINILFYAIWLFLIAVLQPTLISSIGIFGIAPNLFLVFIVAAAMIKGKKTGAVCGFVYGLVFDLLVGRMIGVNALLYMYAGLFAGLLCERFISGTGCVVAAVLVFAISLVCGTIYYIVYNMVWGDMGFWLAIGRVILPEAVYSAILGFVVYRPTEKSFGLIAGRYGI